MKIKDYIEGFDTMTEEEKAKALEEFDLDMPDLSKYVKKEDFDRTKASLDKASSELAQKKKEDREKLTETEQMKLQYEDNIREMQERLNDFQRKSTIDNYGKKLAKLGFENADTMAESLPNDIGDDFFSGLEKWKADAEKAIKANIVMGTPRPEGGGKPDTTVTKEQFDKMSYSEMVKLKEENPDLYAELRG